MFSELPHGKGPLPEILKMYVSKSSLRGFFGLLSGLLHCRHRIDIRGRWPMYPVSMVSYTISPYQRLWFLWFISYTKHCVIPCWGFSVSGVIDNCCCPWAGRQSVLWQRPCLPESLVCYLCSTPVGASHRAAAACCSYDWVPYEWCAICVWGLDNDSHRQNIITSNTQNHNIHKLTTPQHTQTWGLSTKPMNSSPHVGGKHKNAYSHNTHNMTCVYNILYFPLFCAVFR